MNSGEQTFRSDSDHRAADPTQSAADIGRFEPLRPLRSPRGHVVLPVWMAPGLLASLAVLIVLMHDAGLAIDPHAPSTTVFSICGIIALLTWATAPRLRWRHARVLGDGAAYYAAFTAIALTGAVASYPIAALSSGYSDSALQHADLMLGFNWLAWYRAVAESRTLQILGTAAYRSIYLTPALLLAYYAAIADRPEAHRFLATFWLAAIVTLAMFSLMPAVVPFSYLWHGPFPYMPDSELWQPDLIPQLRAHTVHFIDLGQLRGLVSAPSFHAAAATIYAAFAWRARLLRWPLLAINAAILMATPVEGTHYLADILIGMIVALVALVVVYGATGAIGRAGPFAAERMRGGVA